eukprot:gene26932-33584_t
MGFSMGVHNGAAKESIPNCPSTTVMTMTIVTLSGHASNTLNYWMAKYSLLDMQPSSQTAVMSKLDEKFRESRAKLMTSVKPLVTFLLGALVGAAAMTNLDYWCMLLPMGVVLVKIIDIYCGYCLESSNKLPLTVDKVVLDVVHSPTAVHSPSTSSSPSSNTSRLSVVSPEAAMEEGKELSNNASDSRL